MLVVFLSLFAFACDKGKGNGKLLEVTFSSGRTEGSEYSTRCNWQQALKDGKIDHTDLSTIGFYFKSNVPEDLTYSEELTANYDSYVDEDSKGLIEVWINKSKSAVGFVSERKIQADPNSSFLFAGLNNGNNMRVTTLKLDNFYTDYVTNMKGMFWFCSNLKNLDLSKFNTSNVTNMSKMFFNCSALTTLGLSSFNTSNVTDMSGMYYKCYDLTNLDLTSFNTSRVTTMEEMFYLCQALTSVNLSSFNTSEVTSVGFKDMFYCCRALTSLDLSNFNTSKATSLYRMFYSCSVLETLNVSSFDTSNVTTLYQAFADCSKLTTLNLNNFNTSNVTNWTNAFFGTFGSNASTAELIISDNFTYKNGTTPTQFDKETMNSITSLNTKVKITKNGTTVE